MLPIDFKTFKETLDFSLPPEKWTLALKALWYDAKGDWNASHNIAQDLHTPIGSWIYAYLHRKEGDDWNAAFWYRQADQPFPKYGMDEELKQLVEIAIQG
nr:hypothetical protein [uncultured Allomuricauda sp.]